MSKNLKPGFLYVCKIGKLRFSYGKSTRGNDITHLLKSGRTNYSIFEYLIGEITGLQKGKEGSDHFDLTNNLNYEQKSYVDQDNPSQSRGAKFIHSGPSSVFANNSSALAYKNFIEANNYKLARKLCREKGYNKNDFYIFTNTSDFSSGEFNYFVLSRADVLKNVVKTDPAVIDRDKLIRKLKLKRKTIQI